MNMSQVTLRTRRRYYPHGTAIDPSQIKDDIFLPTPSLSASNREADAEALRSVNANTNNYGSIQMSDLFVTMCFFARLGFVQPPSCLKCAYRSSRCSSTNNGAANQKNNNHSKAEKKDSDGRRDGRGGEARTESASTRSTPTAPKSCGELVAWRVDANIPLHPDNLEGNIVFITCDTARSLVNGDAYPSVRWDVRNKRLLH